MEIPWSYLGEGLWKAECVCTAEYFREPVTDDRVRNDPLEITHRGAPECELRGETDHAVLRLALKATEKDGYGWVQFSACDSGWQVPYYAESVG